MTETSNSDCSRKCWTGAAIAGAVAFVVLGFGTGMGVFMALVIGLVVFGGLGVALGRMVCGDASRASTISSTAAAAGASAAASPTAAAVAPTPQPDPADVATPDPEIETEAARVKPSAELAGEAELAARKGEWAYDAPEDTEAAPEDAPLIKPSTPLAGEAELATRRGSWTYTARTA